MQLNEYQARAINTCMASCYNISYMLFNLVGEIGELASKFAKDIRRGDAIIANNHINYFTDTRDEEALKAEAGDILWQLSGLCSVMGWELEDIAQSNLDKLASRQQRNVIDGNGDNR